MDFKEHYSEGFKLIAENAQILFDTAEKAGHTSHFGVATSLMILSAEESMKALMCSMKFNDPTFPLKHWDEVFKYHDIKHERIEGTLIAIKVYKEQMDAFREEIPIKLEQVRHLTGENWESFKAAALSKFDELQREMFPELPDVDVEMLLPWWKKANSLKNRGLYVGKSKQNDRWETPTEVTRNQYLQAREYANVLIECSKYFMNLYATGEHKWPSTNLD